MPAMLARLAHRLLKRAFCRLVRRGALTVLLPSGERQVFGDGMVPAATIRFTDNRAIWALLRDPEMQLGQLFMDERLRVEQGTVYDLLTLLLQDARSVPPSPVVRVIDAVRLATRRFVQHNVPRRARANVAHHYDLGDDLYTLFLDSDRQYSCAYFEYPEQSLEDAQRAKKRHIAAKLLVEPGHRVLDIGCGWGGLSQYLAQVAGAGHVTGITLSTEQLAYARRRAETLGLAGRLDFRLEDYRATQGRFERIVSVGMFEHVGIGYHDAFFRQCRELLTDDGVMLLHFIGNSDVPDFTNPWIVKYIFPGGHIPSLSECTPAIERAGLVITDIEVLRLHYAQTLRLWRQRFMARRAEAVALYDERFCRMWEFYLSLSEAAFHYQDIAIFQIQLARRQESVPLTRDYVGQREAALARREAAVAGV